MLTWGSYSKGALGLGDPVKLTPGTPGAFRDEQTRKRAVERGHGEPPEVLVPTEVRFDHGLKHPRKRFCFGVTAAGWHTGALVIDLEVRSPRSLASKIDLINQWYSPEMTRGKMFLKKKLYPNLYPRAVVGDLVYPFSHRAFFVMATPPLNIFLRRATKVLEITHHF